MHACIAIDGTAKNLYGVEKAGKKDYKNCIREYWWIVEAFTAYGLNLKDLKFPHLTIYDGYKKQIVDPDIADVIYHAFRCSDAHAQEIPEKYRIKKSIVDGLYTWQFDAASKTLRMPETIIWGLLAVSVFCQANAYIKTSSLYYLSWGNEFLKIPETRFLIKDNWGNESILQALLSKYPTNRIDLTTVFSRIL